VSERSRTAIRRAGKPVGPLILAVLVLGLVLAAANAPYVYAELWPFVDRHTIVEPGPAKIAKGRMADDYFAVQALGDGVFAIGEPRYYQQNYAYLITGRTRALLFDSGSGTRDISPVVASLTHLPVTVMVSHLHFDHLGGVGPFHDVAMVDLPRTRADVSNGVFKPGRYEWMGHFDHRPAPSVRVSEWLKPGDVIDLGGRTLTVLSTPGHTPTSVALYDGARHWLFIGDFVYPGPLYAFLPGASLSAYQATDRRLLATLPPDTVLWAAHCCRKGGGIEAPWLSMGDLRDLDAALTRIRAGQVKATGFYPRVYPVNGQMTLDAGLPWTNR
jgi:glyoxylase-like metal-dependent hydrolase (beta-lactamase superfamily II)